MAHSSFRLMPLHGLLESAFTTYTDAPASQAAVIFNENALLLTFHSAVALYIICIEEHEKKNESGA